MQQEKLITNEAGRTFRVRIVLPGERYGLDDCLVYDEVEPRGDCLIEFWDMGNTALHGPDGQFTGGRYYLSTLLEDAPQLCRSGLDLDTEIPLWTLDGPAVRDALVWALATIPWQTLSERVSERVCERVSERIPEPKPTLKIRLVFCPDDSADTSTIGEYSSEPFSPRAQAAKAGMQGPAGWVYQDAAYVIDRQREGDMDRGEYRYFVAYDYLGEVNPKTGKPWAESTKKRHARKQYERMEALSRGDWEYVGLQAEAIIDGDYDARVVVTSNGLWGVESDSGDEYFDEILAEETQGEDFRGPLYALGYTDDEINEARDFAEKIEVGR